MAEQNSKRMVSVAFVAMLLLAVGGVATYWYVMNKGIVETERANAAQGSDAMKQSLKMEYTRHELNKRFVDADSDLIADTPTDETKQLNPETITFSYVGGDPAGSEKIWQELIDHLKKVTQKNVAYLPAANIDEQLWQLHEGKLHVTVVNSGAVPLAVNECGFVPAFTTGTSGYRMLIITPADSSLKKVEDIRMLTLADNKSNSGYKLPLLLMKERQMAFDVDFKFNLSFGQKRSIAGIAAKQYEAAAVASDLLEREISAGAIKKEDYRELYRSDEYPKAAVGYVYNLRPELAKKIKAGLESFVWASGTLSKEYAEGGKFVPTNYAKDWAGVREVANSFKMGDRIEGPVMASAPATQEK